MDTAFDSQVSPPAFSTPGNIRPYKHEHKLYAGLAIVAITLLVILTLVTFGLVWIYVLFGYVIYLIVASYLISYVRGNGVQISAEQFPELHAKLLHCSKIAGLSKPPEFYLVAGDGVRNAFATRFLNRYYVVLLSDIVDALDDDEDALNFYIGHELGHIAQSHVARMWWIRLAMFIPLLGTAYSRAREYTCDQYGLACCPSVKSAVNALTVLAAGSQRWKKLHQRAYMNQIAITGGFWMSLNELTADYPWLCKRVTRVYSGDAAEFPRRHIAAWLIAGLIPRTGLGLLGGMILMFYLVVVAAFVFGVASSLGSLGKLKDLQAKMTGIPVQEAASDTVTDMEAADAAPSEPADPAVVDAVNGANSVLQEVADRAEGYIKKQHRWPTTAKQIGYALPADAPVASVALDESQTIRVSFKAPYEHYFLQYVRMSDLNSDADWGCHAVGIPAAAVPVGCELTD